MDFGLDETQRAVAELAAGVLRAGPDDARTRAALAGEAGYDEATWKALAQAGLLALAVPEKLGGDGCGALEVGLVLFEVGRQTLPLPALATLALGVLPVAAAGTAEQQAALLAEIADGQVLTAGLRDAPAEPLISRGGALSGARIGVPYAAQAQRILLPTEHGVAVVDRQAAGVTLVRTPTSTGAPEYTVRLAGVRAEMLLAGSARDVDRFAVAGAAAVADGILAGALQLTSEHLRTRRQFGRPLATFQAVAQEIADVYIAGRTVHLAALSAAWRLASATGGADVPKGTEEDLDEDVALAGYWLASEVPKAVQVCHHLHGGLGVDSTYPLHRYFAHAKDLARLVGGAAYRLDRLGERCSSS